MHGVDAKASISAVVVVFVGMAATASYEKVVFKGVCLLVLVNVVSCKEA